MAMRPDRGESEPARATAPRVWLNTQKTEKTLGVIEVVGSPEIQKGDLVVAFSELPRFRPMGIYEVMSGRRNTDVESLRGRSAQASCKLLLELPFLSYDLIVEHQRDLAAFSEAPAERDTRNLNLHERLVQTLVSLYPDNPDIVRDIRRLLTGELEGSSYPNEPEREAPESVSVAPHDESPPRRESDDRDDAPTERLAEPSIATPPAPASPAPPPVTSEDVPASTHEDAPTAPGPPSSITVHFGDIHLGPAPANDEAFWLEVSNDRVETHWRGEPTSRGVVAELMKLAFVADPGAALYNAVICAPALVEAAGAAIAPLAAFVEAREHARRVLLHLETNELHRLPWEAMVGDLARFGLDEKLPIARWVQGSDRAPAQRPLHVVCAVANPRGLADPDNTLLHDLRPIDRVAEHARFAAAIEPFAATGTRPVYINATRAALIEEIARGAHVVHLIAHGLWNTQKGDYSVVLEAEDGGFDICYLGERGDTRGLLSMLGTGDELRLVILGCCFSGAFGEVGVAVKVSLGARLAEVVPSVIAMQDAITPEAVGYFARGFYAGLARTGETDRAAAIGRLLMRTKLPPSDRQWTIPAVFVGTTHPRVFDPDAATEAAGKASATAMAEDAPRRLDDPLASAARAAGASFAQGDAIAAAVRAAMPSAAEGAAAAPAPVALRQVRGEIALRIERPVALESAPVLEKVGPNGTELVLSSSVTHQAVAALNSGKHVIFIGPPGTGKTSMTKCLTDLAEANRFTAGTVVATASADWSTAETVGALLPVRDGVVFRPGLVLDAIIEGKWLVIDEINRAEIDKAFGELFTILSNQPITIPFGPDAQRTRVLPPHRDWRKELAKRAGADPWAPALWSPPDTTAADIVVHPNFRILATMNVYDRSFLFSMSLAFMRRFAFIDVDLPDNYDALIGQWLAPGHPRNLLRLDAAEMGKLNEKLLALVAPGTGACTMLQRHRALGPAILADVLRYVAERVSTGAAWDIALGEGVALYVVPQLDGLTADVVDEIDGEIAKLVPEPRTRANHPLASARLRALYPHVEFD